MSNLPSLIPLSLYIHIPWCVRKCPYCDFNSHALKDGLPEDNYIETLIKDLVVDLPKVQNRSLVSIFFGGGTPSLFSPAAIEKILSAVRAHINCIPNMEITLEANPGTMEQDNFAGFRAAGVNRLSLGIQSLQESKLKALGRIHGRAEAIAAVQAAKTAGFDNFNLDLMYGLPDQTIEEALADLTDAIALKPTHLSWYQLTLEPNTAFFQRPPKLPEHEYIADMQETGQALLAEHAYLQYEVSAYSQSGKHCVHNMNYWEFGDYLGIGAGAHSKITDLNSGIITRASKFKHPKEYLKSTNTFIAEEKIIPSKELPFEFMMNALRLQKPIAIQLFEDRTGLKWQQIQTQIQKAQALELIHVSSTHFQTSETGAGFLNDLLTIFLE